MPLFHYQSRPEPVRFLLDMLVNPRLGSGGEWAEEKEGAVAVNENVRDFYRGIAHACSFSAETRSKRTNKRKAASIGGIVVEISGYEFPRHIEPVAGSRHLGISTQVAGSDLPTALDAQSILVRNDRVANGTLVTSK